MKAARRHFMVNPLRFTETAGRRLVNLSTHILAIFVVSLCGATAAGYFVVNRFSEVSMNLAQFLRGDFVWPIVAVAMAFTVGLAGLMLFIESRLPAQQASGVKADREHPKPHRSAALDDTHEQRQRMLRLTRSAEQLSGVERDLIANINASYDLDMSTHRLILDIQRCTNHLMAEVSDITREHGVLDSPVERESLPR
jgi:hypothetical protein